VSSRDRIDLKHRVAGRQADAVTGSPGIAGATI